MQYEVHKLLDYSPPNSALKLEKCAISKVQKFFFAISKMAKKSIFAQEKIRKLHFC